MKKDGDGPADRMDRDRKKKDDEERGFAVCVLLPALITLWSVVGMGLAKLYLWLFAQ